MSTPFFGRPSAADVKQRWANRGDSVGASPIMTQGKGFYWAYLDNEAYWPHDHGCAVECFKAAAERGSIEAKHYLSVCYEGGLGVEVDFSKSFHFCLEAAQADVHNSEEELSNRTDRALVRRRLGRMYWVGIGTERDTEEGRRWYENARLSGEQRINKMIDTDLAVRMYEDGDYDAAAESLRRIVEWPSPRLRGNAVALYYLGWMLCKGLGVEQNDEDGFDCFERGTQDVIYPHDLWELHSRCVSLCQYWLGCCFDEGRGVSASQSEAVAWWRKAAENGVGEAYNNLGICYVKGEGVQQDRREARRCFELAIENGCEESRKYLDRLDSEETRPSGGFWPHV